MRAVAAHRRALADAMRCRRGKLPSPSRWRSRAGSGAGWDCSVHWVRRDRCAGSHWEFSEMGEISCAGDVLGSRAGTLVPLAASVTQRPKLFTESESPACHQGPHAWLHAGVMDGSDIPPVVVQ